MNALPDDIRLEIARTFSKESGQLRVTETLQSLYATPLNVGPEQLARCILILADGNVEKLESLFSDTFGGDPRDLILAAMDKSGNRVDWGLTAFSQTD